MFKAGEKVRHKTGGPVMVVDHFPKLDRLGAGGDATAGVCCIWWDEGQNNFVKTIFGSADSLEYAPVGSDPRRTLLA